MNGTETTTAKLKPTWVKIGPLSVKRRHLVGYRRADNGELEIILSNYSIFLNEEEEVENTLDAIRRYFHEEETVIDYNLEPHERNRQALNSSKD